MNRIRLDNEHACQVELEHCTNALATFDHTFTQVREAIDAAEAEVSEWTIKALRDIPREKGMTAKELNARIDDWFAEDMEASAAKTRLTSLNADLDKINRYYRSIEKRGMFATSALKGHMGDGRYGGRE